MKKKSKVSQDVESKPIIGDATHRCKLCPDGGEGQVLVRVKDAVRQNAFACRSHAAFYGGVYTGANRKYLPGNEKPVAPAPTEDPDEGGGPAVRMQDH